MSIVATAQSTEGLLQRCFRRGLRDRSSEPNQQLPARGEIAGRVREAPERPERLDNLALLRGGRVVLDEDAPGHRVGGHREDSIDRGETSLDPRSPLRRPLHPCHLDSQSALKHVGIRRIDVHSPLLLPAEPVSGIASPFPASG